MLRQGTSISPVKGLDLPDVDSSPRVPEVAVG